MNILSIDCGTQSLRTIIFSSDGEMLAKVKIEYDPPYYSKELITLSKTHIFIGIRFARRQLSCLKWFRMFSSIIGVTLTTQRATTVVLDKHGEPVRNAILWLDQRLAQGKPNLTWLENLCFAIIGMKDAAKSLEKHCKLHETARTRAVV